MATARSCTVHHLEIDGVLYPLQPFKASKGMTRCGDCGVQSGGYHHLGCDLARCPRCRGQLIWCGCWTDGEEEESEESERSADEERERQKQAVGPTMVPLRTPGPRR